MRGPGTAPAPASGSRSRWRSGLLAARRSPGLLLRRAPPKPSRCASWCSRRAARCSRARRWACRSRSRPTGAGWRSWRAPAGSRRSVWLWSAEDGESRRLEGADGGVGAFFSPDGREIAFFAEDELRRIPVGRRSHDAHRERCPRATRAPGGRSGTILYTRWLGPEAGLWAVPAAGGEPRRLHAVANRADLRAFPSFLPDGEHYLFLKGGMGGEVGNRKVCVAATLRRRARLLRGLRLRARVLGDGPRRLRPPWRARGPALRRKSASAGGRGRRPRPRTCAGSARPGRPPSPSPPTAGCSCTSRRRARRASRGWTATAGSSAGSASPRATASSA